MHLRRTGLSERGRRSRCRRPRRINVVDEHDPSWTGRHRLERAADVATALRRVETGLATASAGTRQEQCGGERPAPRELVGQALRRVTPAPQLPHRVAGYGGDDVGRRPFDMSGDELGGELGYPAEPVLLPRPDERASRAAVGDRCACPFEREAPPGALAAPGDRPRSRSTTAVAARRAEWPQLEQTGRTQQVCRAAARDAGTREEKIHEPRGKR